jgi:hypothetical protein
MVFLLVQAPANHKFALDGWLSAPEWAARRQTDGQLVHGWTSSNLMDRRKQGFAGQEQVLTARGV